MAFSVYGYCLSTSNGHFSHAIARTDSLYCCIYLLYNKTNRASLLLTYKVFRQPGLA